MERNIIVKASGTTGVKVIKSNAVTVADLKAELDQIRVSYQGYSLIEAISKTRLESDDQQLPTTVTKADGTQTSDLIVVITNTNKQIKSGATRQELYDMFRNDATLQTKCVERFGRTYSSVATKDLEMLVNPTSIEVKTVDTVDVKVFDFIKNSTCISCLCEVIAAASERINALAMCKCEGENPVETTEISQDELDSYLREY